MRGVVSNGMLCSAKELEVSEESDGILDLPETLAVGTPAAAVFGADPVIDFEVTPNRPDWLGVAGIARDLAAAGVGKLITPAVESVPGQFPCPIDVKVDGDACPVFAGRLIRGVKNGPSPEWLQQRLRAIGLRPISALVDVTNLLSYDRARPLHVYDAQKLVGGVIEARLGHHADHGDEHLIALDGKTYDIGPQMCVIADAAGERPIGLGGVMGGESTGCSEDTQHVFVESALFDPIRTAQTGRDTGITSDAQYRFARGVDTGFIVDGLELATKLILDVLRRRTVGDRHRRGDPRAAHEPFEFDPAYVEKLSGLKIDRYEIAHILEALGFTVQGPAVLRVTAAHLAARRGRPRRPGGRSGADQGLRRTALHPASRRPATKPGGVLTPKQARVRAARRALAALGYQETVGWSFTSTANARLFGGGDQAAGAGQPHRV